ncbi:MAG TPA: hypothetical protein VFY23_03345 [Candidatus Limnocylindrales bacterium]|nr:hypothetical protein [Candidatus Limnocylindrales bacterium]
MTEPIEAPRPRTDWIVVTRDMALFAAATLAILAVGYSLMAGIGSPDTPAPTGMLRAAAFAQIAALLVVAFVAGRRRSLAGLAGVLAGYLLWLGLPALL